MDVDRIFQVLDSVERREQREVVPVGLDSINRIFELADEGGEDDQAPVYFDWLVVGIALTCSYNLFLSRLWRGAVAVAA